MSKAPAFQFYPADWLGDIKLQACSIAAQGLLINLMCLMHQSEEYGVLLISGRIPDHKTVAKLTRLSPKKYAKYSQELIQNEVLRVREDGALFCKRMVEDQRIRGIRKVCGGKGGNPRLVNQKDKQTGNQNPTPSSSSSSSSPSSKSPPSPPLGGDSDCTPEKPKRPQTGNTAGELRAAVAEYTDSPELRAALEEFRIMRERIRKPMTGKALNLLLGNLDKLGGGNDAHKVAIVEQSIMNSWQGIFPLKAGSAAPGKPGTLEKNMATAARVLEAREQRRMQNDHHGE